LIAVRGNLSSLRRSKIAIVGARNASTAGLAFTSQLARGIARAGQYLLIVSCCGDLQSANNSLHNQPLSFAEVKLSLAMA
jgi:hypothetical protein